MNGFYIDYNMLLRYNDAKSEGGNVVSITLKKSFTEKIHNDPSRDSTIKTIEDICWKVDEGKIVMPIFQTGLRWTPDKMCDLLTFQLTGFAAVAPLSMCKLDFGFEPTEEVYKKYGTQITLLTREKINGIRGEVESVTDGQQRTTTNYLCYIGHELVKNFMLDLKAGKVIIINDNELPKEGQIPVGVIYNKDFDVYEKYLSKHPELQANPINTYVNLIRTKFFGYRYTVNLAKNLTEKQQMGWFEILNNAGSNIPLKEMRLSRLKLKDVDYHSSYIFKFLEDIENTRYENVFPSRTTRVSYPLAALNPAYDYLFSRVDTKRIAPIASDVKEARICALETEQLEQLFSMTLDALKLALKFIEDNEIHTLNRIEYVTFVMGYYIDGNNERLTTERKNYLIEWFEKIDFTDMTNRERREAYYRLIHMMPVKIHENNE